MKAGAPWSVKGVELDARETAKAKARAAGMTLGQWLNRAIVEADKPAPPAPAPQGGGSLETARVMRAIAELARRVDQLRDAGGSAIPEAARLEAALDDIGERVDRMARALPAPEQQIDQPRLERGLLTIVRRLDELDRKTSEQTDLTPLREGLSRLEQRIGGAPEDRAGLEDVRRAVTELAERLDAPPGAGGETAELKAIVERQAEDIRKLMNGMVNIAAKIDEVEAAVKDTGHGLPAPRDADARPDQFAEELAALRRELAERDSQTGPAGRDAAFAAMLAPVTDAIRDLEGRLGARERAQAESDALPPPADAAEPATEDAEAEPPAPEAEDEPADAPLPEASPELAALHDLTARQDERIAPRHESDEYRDPLFHDLPPFDDPDAAPEEEQGEEIAADAEPEPEAAAAIDPIETVPPRSDGGPAMATEIPEDATPDRPRRLVPVESLLGDTLAGHTPPPDDRDEGGLGGVGAFGDDGGFQSPGREEPEATRRDGGMRLDRPIDIDRREPPAPAPYPPRRRGRGYLVAAVIFLALLLGGYWFVGTPAFQQVAERAKALWEDGLTAVGRFELPAGGEEPGAEAPMAESEATAPAATERAPETASPEPASAAASAASSAATDEPPLQMETSETDLAAVKPEEPAAPASAPQESEVDPVLAAARDGDAEAQYEMAIRYRDGVGVDVSYGEAADWFDRAAQQGHVDAQANLGVMYRQGVGVPRDIDLAKLWLHAAARSGHADAQKYLGEVYAQDDLGTPDYFQAARWFREAAEQGLVDAQYNMGVLYEGGLGVPRDFEQAYYWFRLAARSGDETAEADVRRVIPLLTQEQRTEVDARVDAFTPASGENAATAPSDSGQTLTRRDQIRELQQLLVDRGYDPGEPDGLIGARTRDAIRQWQESQGLPETGQVTMQVLEGLRSGG
ncbi:SEL1-like repeat protein [Minwuia thermotolerans]|uniref:Peptidoglycan binding-like domain-containing protein n=1 Tax=Minwuia thermotolerans TaxID=2056226 RepID=A0A2M9G0B1_9PROT|nr:SEL1-like repeat protein [Minwuia thermotolerans]PJK29161.1 hypothetical protein CVT23_13290 [Minwuia thermotolerans]